MVEENLLCFVYVMSVINGVVRVVGEVLFNFEKFVIRGLLGVLLCEVSGVSGVLIDVEFIEGFVDCLFEEFLVDFSEGIIVYCGVKWFI